MDGPESKESFESRKKDHIDQSLNPANQALGMAGLEGIHLYHDALPELDMAGISIESTFLAESTPTPFSISGMTAGHVGARNLNEVLAKACDDRGWVFGVGSQRRDLERGDHEDQWAKLRKRFPKLKILANIGVSQVVSHQSDALQRILDGLEPQALAIHLNALQEAIQPEGTPQFKGALDSIARLAEDFPVPVVLKETGCGFSKQTLHKIKEVPIRAIDVSGVGGTHWGRIEGKRAAEFSLQEKASLVFANWGESTVDSLLAAKATLPNSIEIWASGGLRSGLDAAKAIALGARRASFAQPALKAAMEGEQQLNRWMEEMEFELRIALFCTGSESPTALREKEGSWVRKNI